MVKKYLLAGFSNVQEFAYMIKTDKIGVWANLDFSHKSGQFILSQVAYYNRTLHFIGSDLHCNGLRYLTVLSTDTKLRLPASHTNLSSFLSNFYSKPLPNTTRFDMSHLNVSYGNAHCFIYSKGDSIFGGNNRFGQAGTVSIDGSDRKFYSLQLPFNSLLKKIASGSYHSMILMDNGILMGSGLNADSQCGFVTLTPIAKQFREVKFPNNAKIIDIVCGNEFNFALAENGDWYSWGNNERSQLLVDSKEESILEPQKNILTDYGITNIKLGSYFGVGLKDGSLYIWGDTCPGMLNVKSKDRVVKLESDLQFKSVHVKGMSIAAVTESGKIFYLGPNTAGFSKSETQFFESLTPILTPGPVDIIGLSDRFMVLSMDV